MEAFAKAGFWRQLHAALDKQVFSRFTRFTSTMNKDHRTEIITSVPVDGKRARKEIFL